MAGYKGYSMSNNAVSAYSSGEKPMSKWTKEAVISSIARDLEIPSSEIRLLKPFKEYLSFSSWHHTSKKYNCTNFYVVNFEMDQIEITESGKQRKRDNEYVLVSGWLENSVKRLDLLKQMDPKADAVYFVDGNYTIVKFPNSYKESYLISRDFRILKGCSPEPALAELCDNLEKAIVHESNCVLSLTSELQKLS